MTLSPRVVFVTALETVPEAMLMQRLDDAARLGPSLCRYLAVELRDPELEGGALLAFGERLRQKTRAMGAALIVNDRLDVARALGADGVHLGRRSVAIADARALLGAGAWVSIACHGVEDVTRAARAGANASLLSPIFASPGKGAPLGLEALGAARAAIGDLPLGLLALGGVDESTAPRCLEAGATGVAVVRADLGSTLRRLLAR